MHSHMQGGSCVEVEIPLHLSIVWIPVLTPNPRYTGSLGAGILLRPGVRLRICSSGCHGVHGELLNMRPVRRLAERLGFRLDKLCVDAYSPIEPGVGLGVSAAATLALAISYAALKRMNTLEAADEAHIAEVESLTGLGDVSAEYHGRCIVVRESPGAPSIARIYSIPTKQFKAIVVVYDVDVDTKLLVERGIELQRQAVAVYKRVVENPSIDTLRYAAEEFAARVTPPPPEAKKVIEMCARRTLLTVYKKRVLVLFVDEQDYWETLDCVRRAGVTRAKTLEVSTSGWSISEV